MAFVEAGNEKPRVLVLVIAAAALEIFLISWLMFSLLKTSAQWPLPLHLLAIALPRFVLMALLVAVLGPFQQRPWVTTFLLLYAALLLIRFNQAEAFVDWSNSVGATRATLPYVSGFLGAILGFWWGRRDARS